MGKYHRNAPSTKARREGYAQMHKLSDFLLRLFVPDYESFRHDLDKEMHWIEFEFNKSGWRDYMIRHTPALKRGGPATLPPSKSKRRQRREKERKATIR